MAEDNKGKVGFFKRMLMGIKDFDKYGVLASEKVGTAVKYLLTLVCIFIICISAVFTYKFYSSAKAGLEYYNQNIQDISYKDEKLSINEGKKIEMQNDESLIPYIMIHTGATKEETEKHIEKLNLNSNGILVLNDKIIYRNEMVNQNIEYSYDKLGSNYQVTEFNKQQVEEFIKKIDGISLYVSFYIVMFIYLYIVYLFSILVDVFVLALLGFIFARIAGLKMRFKANFNMAVYALTLPILLNLIYIVINFFTGFEIKYFQWMYTTISYIYMIVAILMIKADFIHKQVELQKIIEEQKRVKEEMQKREEEKKEEQKDENEEEKEETPEEEKTKKKKRSNKNNDLGNEGLAPQEIKDLPDNQ